MSDSKVKYVDHTYRDFSRYVEDGGHLVKHKKSASNFPAKLHRMLADPRHEHVITWMPHGRAFKILDKDLLFSAVLPQYYVCNKYESFTRQLNAWGFKRLYQSGPDLGCFYHECFLRGLPKLTCLIRRLPPSQGKATPYPAGEPNFYTISAAFPLPSPPPPTASARSSSPAEDAAPEPPALEPLARDRSQSEQSEAGPPLAYPGQPAPQGFASGVPWASLAYAPARLQEPTHQGPVAALSATALGEATPRHGPSAEIRYPSASPVGQLPHEYQSARRTYEATPRMPQHHSPGYQYPPHPGLAAPATYAPPPGYAVPREAGYGPPSAEGPHPPYQYRTAPYPTQQRRERPRFRYPPPQLPQYFAHASAIGGEAPQGGFQYYQRSNVDAGQSLQAPAASHGGGGAEAYSLAQSLRDIERNGVGIEPLPYSPRTRARRGGGSPTPNRRRPDPPP